MRTSDGLKVLDYTNFTQDVEGQMIRGKLRLGPHEQRIKDLLPAIEAAMKANDIVYEHSALNGIATGQLAVVSIDGWLYRIGIAAAPKWEDNPRQGPPMLVVDGQWSGTRAGRCKIDGAVDLVEGVGPKVIDSALKTFATKVRATA